MKSILIVDDDTNTINGLLDHVPWERLGISPIDYAQNGAEALEKIREQEPDILITDIYMPKMDGLQLIKKVRHEFPNIYIVVHSGYDDFDNARQAMKYGVQHYLLKPCLVPEIEAVINEIMNEILVEEKQSKLLENYNEEMDEHIAHSRESFFREILISKNQKIELPPEKLAIFNIPEDPSVLVANISLIRFSSFTKSNEREWQLKKFGANNIIKETIEGSDIHKNDVDVHIVDYSDFTFILIFFAKKDGIDLNSISYEVSKTLVNNILLYLNLSLVVGMGTVKQGVRGLLSSYMESQKALEAAEYQEINKVYAYHDVHKEKTERFQYPFETLKDIYNMIHYKELEFIMDKWSELEDYLLVKNKAALTVTQNICLSVLNLLNIQEQTNHHEGESLKDLSTSFTRIYAMQSTKDVVLWTREKIEYWLQKFEENMDGKSSNQLVREVKKYVRDHYDDRVVLAEIAESLFVNRNYLSQLFKKVTGETFVTYLNKYRINKAQEKLREKNYMIYEVSEMVGYQNSTYFSQVFKSITGVSPSDFYEK